MGYVRVLIDPGDTPAFSVALPPGLVHAGRTDIENPPLHFTFASRFAAIAAVNGPASITFSIMPAKSAQSLSHVLQQAAAERGQLNPSIYSPSIGGELHRHPGLATAITAGCEFALFEVCGNVIIMEASGVAEIWPEYQPFLEAAMLSVELVAPMGPTLPLSPGGKAPELEGGAPDPDVIEARNRATDLERKAAEARKLIANGDYDAAEALLVGRNDAAEVRALIGRLFEDQLRDGGAQEPSIRKALYRRALDWTLRAYPDPHTQMEADAYRRGSDEDRARLTALLGNEET